LDSSASRAKRAFSRRSLRLAFLFLPRGVFVVAGGVAPSLRERADPRGGAHRQLRGKLFDRPVDR
jgi:hypothetical protein